MIFSEIYSAYYNAMAKLIDKAIKGELNAKNASEIINTSAFSESSIYILDNIKTESWSVINKDFKTPINNSPVMPLTLLQKRFLKTILLDPRFKLFCDENLIDLPDIEPLYFEDDLYYFDIIKDGDPYQDEDYISNFRKVLKGLKLKKTLRIVFRAGDGILRKGIYTPRKLEYSEKDDKFRLLCMGENAFTTINLARIKSVEFAGVIDQARLKPYKRLTKTVTLQITNYRNALERSLLHFAHFEKETRKTGDNIYQMSLTYYADDETEVLIRILSFGPMVKVISPNSFIDLIKERINNQKSCE